MFDDFKGFWPVPSENIIYFVLSGYIFLIKLDNDGVTNVKFVIAPSNYYYSKRYLVILPSFMNDGKFLSSITLANKSAAIT
jgi:hypothetical protein